MPLEKDMAEQIMRTHETIEYAKSLGDSGKAWANRMEVELEIAQTAIETKDPEKIQEACERLRNQSHAKLEKTFQQKTDDWIVECFGLQHSKDKEQRNQRFIEEAIELVQACEMPKEDVLELVEYVYGREPGVIEQEVGGVKNTLAALCNAQEVDMDNSADKELNRCWKNMDEIKEKQKNKPKLSPLPGKAKK